MTIMSFLLVGLLAFPVRLACVAVLACVEY